MENSQEVLVATWQEKPVEKNSLSPRTMILATGAVVILTIISIVIGFFAHDWSWYLAAAVIVSAAGAIFSQMKQTAKPREINITNQRVVVEDRSYAITEMAGFWLEEKDDSLIITFEQKRRALLPLTCYYQDNNTEEVTEILTQVLPEVDARPEHFTDQVNKYFHF